MDASVHTFGCPIVPVDIGEVPESQVHSMSQRAGVEVESLNMVRNTGEAEKGP